MLRETARTYWKHALRIFLLYVALVFVVGIISSRLNDIAWSDILSAYRSWRVWTTILIPGILILLVNLIPWQIFVQMFIVVFGVFLLISGLAGFESIAEAIKGSGDVELLAFGTTVVAIGLAFMQLHRQPVHTANDLKTIKADLDKIRSNVESMNVSIEGLRARIDESQSINARDPVRKRR